MVHLFETEVLGKRCGAESWQALQITEQCEWHTFSPSLVQVNKLSFRWKIRDMVNTSYSWNVFIDEPVILMAHPLPAVVAGI